MSQPNEVSYHVPFTADSSLADGLHVSAALGGGTPHAFLVDTGSVGILVPRQVLGPDYQDFDPSQDITFGYVSSGNTYQGQWVKVPVVLGVPAAWDGTGDYPVAHIEVFAVDQPDDFDGGVFGIGFGIGGLADGGPGDGPGLSLQIHRHVADHLLGDFLCAATGRAAPPSQSRPMAGLGHFPHCGSVEPGDERKGARRRPDRCLTTTQPHFIVKLRINRDFLAILA